MHNSLVLPYFAYCSIVWDDNNISQTNNLFKLQKRAARVITNLDYAIRSIQMKTILDKQELKIMLKILKGMAPNYLKILFNKCNNVNHDLRTNDLKMSLPKQQQTFSKRVLLIEKQLLGTNNPLIYYKRPKSVNQ